MKISYYPGCTLKNHAKNFEDSTICSLNSIGVEVEELSRWNCCGTVFSLTSDDLMHHIAPIRILVRAQEMNGQEVVEEEYRLVTLCSMCFNTLKRSNIRVRESPQDLKTINDFMDREPDYDGRVEVKHFLELVRERGFNQIREKVKTPLGGLKVFPYYGCMLLRPKDAGIDDPEDPSILEDLVSALGAEPVDTPFKKVCCGSYQTVNNKESVRDLVYDILTGAQKVGAQTVITSCPLCAFNLDSRQKEVREHYPEFTEIPVLYFSQLMAIAFGLGDEVCGFDLHFVDPRPLPRHN